jgi:hypothetical protein
MRSRELRDEPIPPYDPQLDIDSDVFDHMSLCFWHLRRVEPLALAVYSGQRFLTARLGSQRTVSVRLYTLHTPSLLTLFLLEWFPIPIPAVPYFLL